MAQLLDLNIDAGGLFIEYITWYDVTGGRMDLSGFTAAKMTLRNADDLTVLLTIDLTTTGSKLFLETDATLNEDFGEVVSSTTGVITIRIEADDTATFSGLSAIYDLILTPPGGAIENVKLTKGSGNIDTLVTT